MPKFFTARENITESEILIDSEDARHISKVLRLGRGDVITVCDGRGIDYEAEIREISPREILCDIKSSRVCDSEPRTRVTLFQGLPKAAKMDYIIQKTTELGICRIVPVKLSRCVAKINDDKTVAAKTERWQKIAAEAAKQSGRGIIPEVRRPVTFDEALTQMLESDLAFAPYECETTVRLRDVVTAAHSPESVSFIIGPEGGFDITETEKLSDAKIPTITLGRRILRTETAGEAVLAMLMYALGEL